MLEALLLTAMNSGSAAPFTESPAKNPSLELLEFLGEFGDDEEGLFEGTAPAARAPTKEVRDTPAAPAKPAPPRSSSPPVPAPKEAP